MAGFDAGQVAPELRYNFTKYSPGAVGVTPEPPDDLIFRVQKRMSEIITEENERFGYVDEKDPVAVATALAGVSEEDMAQVQTELLDLYSALTQGKPTRDEMVALPLRVRQAYFGWLMGQLNPEYAAAATDSSSPRSGG